MGTEFAIIYDVITAGLLIGMLFAGFKRGFASAIVSLGAVIIAFICAMAFSEPISSAVYTNFAEKPIEETVSATVDDAVGSITLSSISDADYSEIRVNGVSVEDIDPDYAGTNKAVFDLNDVDLSESGITAEDLRSFGMKGDIDLTSVSGKTAEFTRTDIDRYGLGRMVVAQVIAVNVKNANFFDDISEFVTGVGEAVPMFFGGMAEDIAGGKDASMRSVILIMMSSSASVKDAVINGIIEPCVKIFVQTLAFGVIFLVVAVGLGLLSKLLKFVNKIPVIGGFNAFCGGVIGLAEGIVGVFVVCLAVRVITILSGGNIMFFNDAAIDSTFLFNVFYDFDFLNFINDIKIG